MRAMERPSNVPESNTKRQTFVANYLYLSCPGRARKTAEGDGPDRRPPSQRTYAFVTTHARWTVCRPGLAVVHGVRRAGHGRRTVGTCPLDERASASPRPQGRRPPPYPCRCQEDCSRPADADTAARGCWGWTPSAPRHAVIDLAGRVLVGSF